jgi:CO/xanthine dehydrogenase FAD-binding subunit
VKPVAVRYERPETVEEAVALLAEHGDEAKVLAGGQSLVPALNMRLARPSVLVDVNRVAGLDRIEIDGAVAIGATVRQADPRLLAHPLVAEAMPFVGHYVTRNRGTVCGSVAHADPAAELPLCLTLLGGSVRAVSARGTREIGAGDFFSEVPFQTALEPDELVVDVRAPHAKQGAGYAFDEFAQRRGDFALAMAAASVEDGRLRVAVGSVVARPTLVEVDPGRPGESAAEQVDPWGNLHASPDYLRQLVRVLVDRVVARARERAA